MSTFRKSSFSQPTGNNCVEVALGDRTVRVRDSKDSGRGYRPALTFTPDEWRAFVAGVKAGEFDLP